MFQCTATTCLYGVIPRSIPDLLFRTASEAVAEAAVPWTTIAGAAAVFPNIAPKNLTTEGLKQAGQGVPLIFFEWGKKVVSPLQEK